MYHKLGPQITHTNSASSRCSKCRDCSCMCLGAPDPEPPKRKQSPKKSLLLAALFPPFALFLCCAKTAVLSCDRGQCSEVVTVADYASKQNHNWSGCQYPSSGIIISEIENLGLEAHRPGGMGGFLLDIHLELQSRTVRRALMPAVAFFVVSHTLFLFYCVTQAFSFGSSFSILSHPRSSLKDAYVATGTVKYTMFSLIQVR